MSFRKFRAAALLATLFVITTLFGGQAKADLSLENRTCGGTVSAPIRLRNNLLCTAQDGLTITADNVDLDLNGHRITGDGTHTGINFAAGVDHVTIHNGIIASFANNIDLDDRHHIVVDKMIFVAPASHAVLVNGGAGQFNTISNNTITRSVSSAILVTTGATNNTISGNTLLGNVDGIEIEAASGNKIDSNSIVGNTGNGISIHDSSGMQVLNNTVRGSGADGIISFGSSPGPVLDGNASTGNALNGISVLGGNSAAIKNNAVTGNGDSGISVDSSIQPQVIDNTASANVNDGILIAADATNAKVAGNKALENGNAGIEARTGSTPLLNNNKASFNGFQRGLKNNDGRGIISTDATTTAINKANGNDVAVATDQCSQNGICSVPKDPKDQPVSLTACNAQIGSSRTLHNPLDCASGDAITAAGNNITIDLGLHRLSTDTAAASASVQIKPGQVNVTILNGVLAESGTGVILDQADTVTLTNVFVAGSQANGILATNASRKLTMTGSTVVTSVTGNGLTLNSTPNTVLTSNTVAGNASSGIFLAVATHDSDVRNNDVIGNKGAAGITLSNVASAGFPDNNIFFQNKSTGNKGNGISLFNASGNLFTENTIKANGIDATGEGIRLDGNTAVGGPGGSPNNIFESNKVNGNYADGVNLLSQSDSNRFKKNYSNDNNGDGFELGASVTGTILLQDRAIEDGANGILVNDADNVSALKPPIQNTLNDNGFLNETVGNDIGNGFKGPAGTPGSGNFARGNDAQPDCDPPDVCVA